MWGQNGKILSLMIMLSHNHARRNSSMCFVSTLIFFKLKKKVLLTYLVKMLTFGQTVDFLTYAKVREIMGQNWNKNAWGAKMEIKKVWGKIRVWHLAYY